MIKNHKTFMRDFIEKFEIILCSVNEKKIAFQDRFL